jgi:hypothetical protein
MKRIAAPILTVGLVIFGSAPARTNYMTHTLCACRGVNADQPLPQDMPSLWIAEYFWSQMRAEISWGGSSAFATVTKTAPSTTVYTYVRDQAFQVVITFTMTGPGKVHAVLKETLNLQPKKTDTYTFECNFEPPNL